MRIRTLDDLRRVDERALIYRRLQSSAHGPSTPEEACELHQENIADTDLTPAVPDGTRRGFDRLRELHTYGVLFYDLYTVAWQMQPFLLEQALGERFVHHYGGTVPFMDRRGVAAPLEATSFDQVFEAVGKREGSHFDTRHLQLGSTRVSFGGTFRALLRWARAFGYLRGQRNRFGELVLVDVRNHIAHPTGYVLTGPSDSAAAVRRLAETVDFLWGVSTPQGRWYPTPLAREVVALGRSEDDPTTSESFPAARLEARGRAGWSYVLLLTVGREDHLHDYDPAFERTSFPCEALWGPGTATDAMAWLDREKPAVDAVDHLDRVFVIRAHDEVLDPPRSVAQAAALDGNGVAGTWHLVRADFPGDAWAHVADLCRREPKCESCRPCRNCPAESVRTGPWERFDWATWA